MRTVHMERDGGRRQLSQRNSLRDEKRPECGWQEKLLSVNRYPNCPHGWSLTNWELDVHWPPGAAWNKGRPCGSQQRGEGRP